MLLTNHALLWCCWLGHITCKIIFKMTCNVSSEMLNPTFTIPYRTELYVTVTSLIYEMHVVIFCDYDVVTASVKTCDVLCGRVTTPTWLLKLWQLTTVQRLTVCCTVGCNTVWPEWYRNCLLIIFAVCTELVLIVFTIIDREWLSLILKAYK